MRMVRGRQECHDFGGRQNCRSPLAPITHATPLPAKSQSDLISNDMQQRPPVPDLYYNRTCCTVYA